MEQLEFLWHWHFLLGVAVGVVVGPHILKLVSKLKK
jgi:hypothetical protein